jgi:SAM-dependent methyltransferase
VADFGCGTGLFSVLIGERVKGVVGLDISRGQLQKARESSGMHPVQADIDCPPFRSRVFQYVFSFTVLHHVEDPPHKMEDLSLYARRGVVCSVLRRTEAERRMHGALRSSSRVKLVSGDDSKDIVLRLDLDDA